MTMVTVSPSILGADFGHLSQVIGTVNSSEAGLIHLDVMDGVFVPNISFGFPVIRHISALSRKPLDVHLMIVDPDRYIQQCRDAGASLVSVHYEACTHLNRVLSHIRELGMKAGVVLNPHTPVSVLEYSLQDADFVLLMSVNPGFGGQKFIPSTYRKIKDLRTLADRTGAGGLEIEIDGGVTVENAGPLADAGADILVAGSAVFKAEDPAAVISAMAHCR